MNTTAKRVTGAAAWAIFLLALLEVGSFALGRILQWRHLIYRVPSERSEVSPTASFEQYMAQRDPKLGWPRQKDFGDKYLDSSGARYSPAFLDPKAHVPCVSMWGDSFTNGSRPDDNGAWGNQLAILLGCRVANYGQGGYSSDQAYLRYLSNETDPSKVVILGHMSENIERNLTRNRDLVTMQIEYALKPRFVLDANGALELVPLPSLSAEELERSVGRRMPLFVLEHESFQPGGPAGVRFFHFPYSVSLFDNRNDFRLRAKLARRPEYAAFYAKGHPLQGTEVTTEIMAAFVRHARLHGKQPFLVIFPTIDDLDYEARTGQLTYQPLLDQLAAKHLSVMDFFPELKKFIGARERRQFFDHTAHYTAEVDREVARFVCSNLKSTGLVKPGSCER